MTDKYHALRCITIVALFCSIADGATNSKKPPLSDQTLKAIRDYMDRVPAPWPDEWNKEYVETIRSVVELHLDVPHYALRLEILGKGFAPSWESLTKTKDRSLFEVYQARIRWYTEHLMGTNFPTAEERKRLRDQYTDIWDYATSSLIVQFPFLRRPPYPGVSCRYQGGYGFAAVIKGPLYKDGERPKEKFKAMKYFHLGHRLEQIVKRERELAGSH